MVSAQGWDEVSLDSRVKDMDEYLITVKRIKDERPGFGGRRSEMRESKLVCESLRKLKKQTKPWVDRI